MDELHPGILCPFCGQEYGLERELVIVQAGEMRKGKKSGRRYFCDQIDHPATNYFHLDCFLTRMDFSESSAITECALCSTKLSNTRWVFRVMIGLIDDSNHTFVPFQDDENLAIICTDCTLEGFGEGDYEEGERILGLAS